MTTGPQLFRIDDLLVSLRSLEEVEFSQLGFQERATSAFLGRIF